MKHHYIIFMVLLCSLFALPAEATKGKKKGSKPQCDEHGYSSEIIKEEKISETCVQYEVKVSYDGTRNYGLSHYSIAIPCGDVKKASNSKGWKMEFGKDRTTGIKGLKVDDISRFGEGKASSFIVKFTWCSTGSCEKELGVVSYKFGQCVAYDTLNNDEGNEPEPPQTCSSLMASLTKTDASCATGNDGSLEVVVQEGKAPFIYTWSNGASSNKAENLSAGEYAVTIVDADGNTLTLNETVTAPQPIVITGTVVNPACSGAMNGSIDLEVSGGSGPLSYSWSNGSTSEDISYLQSGLHTVTVTDSSGCSVQKSFMLTNTSLISATANITAATCAGNDGVIDVTPSGGVAPYTFYWNTRATTEDLVNIGPGNYYVSITDALGCTTDKMYTVQRTSSLAVSYIVTPVSCLGDDSGAIDLSVYGVAPISIQWQDGATTEDRTGLTEGSYIVNISDGSGCSQQINITIGRKPLEVASIVNQPTCSGEPGSITVTPTGVAPFTYEWSNGGTGDTIENLEPGVYSVTVTDATGCSRTLFFAITAPSQLEVTTSVTNADCSGNGAYAIDVEVFGGKWPYSYAWSNGATTQDVSGLSSGTYSVDISDAGGCVVTRTFTLDPPSSGWTCSINPVVTPLVCNSAGNPISTSVTEATYSWSVTSADNSWKITSGAESAVAYYTAGNPGTAATFTLTITKNGCSQTCTYVVAADACIVRDNNGGGDPSSNECTPTTPPVVEQPEPEPPVEEDPKVCCKSKLTLYPNPFKDKVRFGYTAGSDDHIKLEIFDGRGKRLKLVYQGPVKACKDYSFDWHAEGCGKDRYYYYRLTTSKGVENGKLVRK